MNREIYCTNAISSFNVTKNELVMTLVYVPQQIATKNTWWGNKMININPCWLEERSTHNFGYKITPKKLDFLDFAINEEGEVCDIDNVYSKIKDNAIEYMNNNGCSIKDSNFHKWFEKEFNDHYYYETVTGALGQVYKINIFEKGHIVINVNETYGGTLRFSKFIADDFEVGKVLKKVGQAIVEYPFFTETNDGNLNFLKLNDNSDMLLII